MSTKKEVKQRLIPQKNEQPNLLKHSEERYQALFNSMTDMFQVFELVYDSKGEPIDCYFREVNPALEQLTGKTSAQLIGKKVRDLFHFEDYWLERYHRILTTGESESFEDYGKEFDKYYKVIAWKVGENKIASIYTDITTQKNAENSLKQAKDNQYKMLFDSMTELVQTIELTYNKEGRPLDYYIRDINTSFASFLGKTKSELINKKISSVVNKIEESWLNTFAKVESTGKAISFEDYASDFNKYFYCTAWKISKNLLGVSLTDITQQQIERATRAGELANANKKLAFRNKEKEQRTNDQAIANRELAFQNEEKEKRANELALANTELAFQNEEKEKRANELALANTELAFQNEEKEKRADELALANTELAFQNEEKEKRADELAVANTELAFQNEEKEKRANELALANTELAFQNEEKEKRADELAVANTELAFQNEEKEKRANELALANTELAFQNEEKEKRADELAVANTELAFQNEEKEQRADELALANTELAFQNKEKDNRSDELAIAKEEKEKRAHELEIANLELAYQNKEKDKRADELILANKEKEKRAKELAIAKELKQFIDTANAPIFGIDNRGLVNEWNQTSEKITGFKKKEVFGKNLVQTYITEDFRKSVKKVLDDALLGKETANYEFPLFAKDGARVMVLLNSSTRRSFNGKITGVLGVGQDITELDKLRTVSESVAKELRRFIETANAPIFGIDSQGFVNEWNQTSETITGFKKEDVFGKDLIQTYITEDYRESVKKVLDDALVGKETANFEFPLFTKNGQRLMVLLNSSARRNANGKIIGVIGVGQDITELVGYRNELEQKVNERTLKLNKALHQEKELNELKSKFVSTASHEFRTPLSAINFAAGSIKKYWAKMEPIMIEKKLDKIEDQVVHMTKLLDDILIVGQADAGKFKNNPKDLNFGNFIHEIIEEVYNSHNKSHEIILIDTEGLTTSNIFIDEKLGRNIFINLISNAIKFSPHAKKVRIELASKKNHIIISIIDYGIGIYKSELKNIFQPFSRGHNVDLIQGTGLGLSIAKEAIDVMGGKIIVNSTIGNGTSFIVQIPKKN
jgi:PAS domain S-box-containing protein